MFWFSVTSTTVDQRFFGRIDSLIILSVFCIYLSVWEWDEHVKNYEKKCKVLVLLNEMILDGNLHNVREIDFHW